jgi:cell division protein ZapA (FtsZ GTPase activity inhibitor)
MAALNIAYDLLESDRNKEGGQEMLLSLEEKLDQALSKAKESL